MKHAKNYKKYQKQEINELEAKHKRVLDIAERNFTERGYFVLVDCGNLLYGLNHYDANEIRTILRWYGYDRVWWDASDTELYYP